MKTLRNGAQGPIVEKWDRLGRALEVELYAVRDDLLPFPLAGNKIRKIQAELEDLPQGTDVIVTNGAVNSNHCRTVALLAAQHGLQCHLVLHGDRKAEEESGFAFGFLKETGATFDVGTPETIPERIFAKTAECASKGLGVHVIAGGGHTRAGAVATKEAAGEVFANLDVDQVFVASGTGATQGGIVAGSEQSRSKPEVVGVSIARDTSRGVGPVVEAARWAGVSDPQVVFLDEYRAGGYGKYDASIDDAVRLAWSYGIPMDRTYTGKAFAALLDFKRRSRLGERVLFWHTGGLAQSLAEFNTN